jgi:hypothetical protein
LRRYKRQADFTKKKWFIILTAIGSVVFAIGVGYEIYNDQVLKPNAEAIANRAILDVTLGTQSAGRTISHQGDGIYLFKLDIANRGNSNERAIVTLTTIGATVSSIRDGIYSNSATIDEYINPFDKQAYGYSFYIKAIEPTINITADVAPRQPHTEIIYKGGQTLTYGEFPADGTYRIKE